MKKWMVFGVSFVFLLMVGLTSAVRINEIMAKTPESIYGSTDCEWIKLYSDSQKNITNWILNTPGHNLTLGFYIDDFLIITGNSTCFKNNWGNVNENKIIEWSAISLNDEGDMVSLFNDSNDLMDFVEYPPLSTNNTYSLLSNSSWIICDKPTPGSVNSCESQTPDNNDDNNNNETEIYLDASWEEDAIINGEEFEIEVKAYNLKDETYNLKIWIEFEENETVISDRYDEENDEWKSGKYYVDEFLDGEGNKSNDIQLRIREAYEDFDGDAVLKVKLEGEDYIFEEDITILEKENSTEDEEKEEEIIKEDKETEEQIASPTITGESIRLGGPKSSKIKEESGEEKGDKTIYESSSEKMKKYAIYALNIVLIVIIVLLIKKKV